MGEEAVELHNRQGLLLRSVLVEQETLLAGQGREQIFPQFVPRVLCRLVCFVLFKKLVFDIIDIMEKISDDLHSNPSFCIFQSWNIYSEIMTCQYWHVKRCL